jgi:hypothetical protein
MKLGCAGCLGSIVVAVLGLLLLAGVFTIGVRLGQTPDLTAVTPEPADGARAQQKLFDLARVTRKRDTTTLSEGEVNALLSRHLVQARGVRLAHPSARLLGGDRFALSAQSSVRRLLEEVSLGALADALPERWQDRSVWVSVEARVRMDRSTRKELRTEVETFSIGRQPIPAILFRLLVGPAEVGLLRWPLPDHVEQVAIEPGRVVIRTASSR